jgi:hypothetical protein
MISTTFVVFEVPTAVTSCINYSLETASLPPASADFLLGLLFSPEDGSSTFL